MTPRKAGRALGEKVLKSSEFKQYVRAIVRDARGHPKPSKADSERMAKHLLVDVWNDFASFLSAKHVARLGVYDDNTPKRVPGTKFRSAGTKFRSGLRSVLLRQKTVCWLAKKIRSRLR